MGASSRFSTGLWVSGVAAVSSHLNFWLVLTTAHFPKAVGTSRSLMQGAPLGIAGCICCRLGDPEPVRTRAVSVRAWTSTPSYTKVSYMSLVGPLNKQETAEKGTIINVATLGRKLKGSSDL